MFEPKVSVNPRDIYVYQTNLPNPYDLLQLTHINASDYQGNKIYLDKQHLILDTSKVDYSHTGTYTVSISVMDNEMNMTLDYLTIHVLSPEEADRINAKHQSQQVPEKTTKQKNMSIVDQVACSLLIVKKVSDILKSMILLVLARN